MLEDTVYRASQGRIHRAYDPEDHQYFCPAKQGGTTGDPLVPMIGRGDFCFYKEEAQ